MTLGELLRQGEQRLQEQKITDAAVDAWYLLEFVTGVTRTRFLMDRGMAVEEALQNRYLDLIDQRKCHIPLQHLTGTQEFMGLEFQVNQHVLVPRQDTEILVETALGVLRPGMQVLDLCTGSGCIAISLKCLGPKIQMTGSDLSEKALEVAERNCKALNAEVTWINSDLFEKLEGSYDMIVSNPPYIPSKVIETLSEEVRLHEPYSALDGRKDGLYFYRRIIGECSEYLKPEGWLMFEIGYDQGEAVSELLNKAGFKDVTVIRDLAGLDRVVTAKR